jgi:peptidyl-prolyl cis-trans isomerase C
MLKHLLLAQASLLALATALPAWAQDAETPAADAADAAAEAAEAAGAAADAAADAAATAADAAAEATAQAAGDAAAAAAAAAGSIAEAIEPAPAESGPAEPATRDTVVATVNGTAITLGEVALAAGALPPQYQQLPPDVLFAGVTDQLVQQELLAQSLTAVPTRVDLALLNERRTLLAGEVVQEIAAGAVTEEAVQAAYDAAYATAEPVPEWNASHILVATEEEAAAVIARLDAGEEFAAVAAEVSTDTGSGAQGGELGWFSQGMMVPEFEAAVAALQPGERSAPVQSQFGWHVVRLNELRDSQPPAIEEVRGEIEAQVRDEAIQARLAELQAAGEVTTPEPGQFDPAVLADPALLGD